VAFTFTRTISGYAGIRAYHYTITETLIAAASEWTLTGCPINGRIVSYIADLTGGSAATIQPFLSRITGGTTTDVDFISQQAAAAAYINDQSQVVYVGLTGGELFGLTTPDAGADNNVTTSLLIIESVA